MAGAPWHQRRPGVCEVESLPAECREDPAVPELLEAACRLCPPEAPESARSCAAPPPAPGGSSPPACAPREFLPCLEDDGSLGDLALSIAANTAALRRCVLGFLAAYLVTAQYAASTRVLDFGPGSAVLEFARDSEYSWDHGFDLHPFPFWSARRSLPTQLRFHQRFLAAHLWQCDDVHKAEGFRGRYALRAGHDKVETHCAVRLTDWQIVKRCRFLRRRQHHLGMRGMSIERRGGAGTVVGSPPLRRGPHAEGVASIRCPTPEERAAFAAGRRQKASQLGERQVAKAHTKYAQRAAGSGPGAAGLGCESAEAEWKVDMAAHHKCILVVVLERLQLPPGAAVLDWGSGCGHKLTWAAQLYDVDGMGVDIVADSVSWARDYSIGHFCEVDGRFVEWLPDDHFDAVISYAALAHLEPTDQCNTIIDLAGKVRVGGRIWFGWNAPGIWRNDTDLEKLWMYPPEESWGSCFAQASSVHPRWSSGEIQVAWEIIEESYLFPDDMQQVNTYLFWNPAYSLFVTRVPSDTVQTHPW